MADPIVRRGAARGWSALTADPRALARVLDDAPYPAWIHEIADGYPCVAINGSAAGLYDLDPIELVGRPARDTMPETDYASYHAVVCELLEIRRPTTGSVRVGGDDVTRCYDMVVTPILDEHGDVTHVFGVAHETGSSEDTGDKTAEVQASVERLRSVFEASRDALVLMTPAGTCLDANPAAGELVGVAADELVGVDLAPLLATDGLAGMLGPCDRDAPPSGTVTVHRPDGSSRIAEYDVVPHVQPDVHLMMARDVTEEIEAAAARHESESRFRVLADSAPAFLWNADPDGAATTFNRARLDFRGCALEDELAGGLFGGVHPDDRERCLTAFQTALAAHTAFSSTLRLRRADGEYRWLLTRASPRVLPDGTFLGHVGASIDVTDQVEAEVALRAERDHLAAVTDAIQDALIESDSHGRIISANERFHEMTGFATDEVIGADLPYPWWPEEWHDRLVADANEALRSGRSEVDSMFCRKDGTRFPVAISVSTVHDERGVSALVGTVRDMTAREEAADAIRRGEEQLARAQKLEAVGRLAGGIAHDFNNILTAISGHAALMLSDLPDSFEHRTDLEELAGAAERATALVEQLLAFARKQESQPRVLDVHGVITSMEVMLRRLLGSAVGLAVGGPRVPADVRADRSQMEQVFLNLVVNARDACSPTGGQIVVRTEIVDLPADDRVDPVEVPADRYVVVSVRDDGAGMDPATRAQVFEPFFTTKEDKGTGLGLSIVHGIVAQSGGYLDVESVADSGTTVRVYLPYVADAITGADPGPERASDVQPLEAPA